MPTRVRSYSKINVGLAIGPIRSDGFHSLLTLYQTLALHDVVSIAVRRAARTRILLQSNDSRVPTDGRNTAMRIVDKALAKLEVTAEVEIHIQKNLPIQGGMGAGSANAAAALLGLERELGLEVPGRFEAAAEVGSDVPLFLVGGAVLGSNRGEEVTPAGDLTLEGRNEIFVAVALPKVGVSTPQAFREWDRHLLSKPDWNSLRKLSTAYTSALRRDTIGRSSGIVSVLESKEEQKDLAENTLLTLVHTGIENDFEQVVFQRYPSLREIKRHLRGVDSGQPALYAALSGSGSALFGLYRSQDDAEAAQQRVQQHGVTAVVTSTLPQAAYWIDMFAE